MNENWIRWIWASLTKSFNERRQGVSMFFVGHDHQKDLGDSYFEFRLDGPIIDEPSKDYFVIDVFINLLVSSIRDETDVHRIHRLTGIGTACFLNEISVYRYGSGNIDDQSLLGCLQLQEKLIVTQYGIEPPTGNLMRTTVEGHYRMVLN